MFDLTSSYFFLLTDTQKRKKIVYPTITQHSDVVDPIWVADFLMIPKMCDLLGFKFLNGGYGCSKSTESEILNSSPKISGVTKKTQPQ